MRPVDASPPVGHRSRTTGRTFALKEIVRASSERPIVFDTALGALAGAAMTIELLLLNQLGAPGSRPLLPNLAYIAFRAITLCFRRRFPLTVSLLLSASFTPLPDARSPIGWSDFAIGNAPPVVALFGVYTVASLKGRVQGVIGTFGWIFSTTVYWVWGMRAIGPAPLLYVVILGVAAFAAGEVSRRLADSRSLIAARNRELVSARARARSAAASEERERLAVELQGIVGQTLTRMADRAAQAMESLSSAGVSATARSLIVQIERSGRQALREARRALGALREGPAAPPTSSVVADGPGTALDRPGDPPSSDGRGGGQLGAHRRFEALDVTIAGAMLVFLASEIYASLAPVDPPGPDDTGGAAFIVTEILRHPVDLMGRAMLLLPLLTRRMWPMVSGLVIALGSAAIALWGHPYGLGPFMLGLFAVYSAWAFGGSRAGGVCLVAAALGSIPILDQLLQVHRISPLMVYVFLFPIACLLGEGRRRLRSAIEQLQAQSSELERLRNSDLDRARTQERLRIARELHDVMAHSLSVMIIQAGAARTVVGSRPERAREALVAVEAAARGAVTELEHAFDVRSGGSPGGPADLPPGIRDLPGLAAQARSAGIHVDLDIADPPTPLAPGLDISLYRLAQEAMTNIIKHAGPTRARIRLRFPPGAVELDIHDEGGHGRGPATSGGHGLVGMQERATMFGGTLRAGPLRGGGFAVHVSLPLEPADA